jgi:hypothetical protein
MIGVPAALVHSSHVKIQQVKEKKINELVVELGLDGS